MTKTKSSTQLLPVGFYDLLFDEAEKNHQNINKVLDVFFAAKYRLIKTPLVEFEDSFSAANKENSLRTVDVISGKNLIFRNDITLQISRLLNSRLKEEALPIKLCYVGDVLCAKSEDLYADRQQTQVGVEIIGCDQEKSDLEIVETLLLALQKIGVKKPLIELSLPGFLEVFLEEIGLASDQENNKKLLQAIRRKNLSEIEKLAGSYAKIISKIVTCNSGLQALVEEISTEIKSDKIAAELAKAQKISEFLKSNLPEVERCFDLFGDNDSLYHSGIAFDVFCQGFSYPIACGGRYKINDLDAVGATIYMNRLSKISG